MRDTSQLSRRRKRSLSKRNLRIQKRRAAKKKRAAAVSHYKVIDIESKEEEDKEETIGVGTRRGGAPKVPHKTVKQQVAPIKK